MTVDELAARRAAMEGLGELMAAAMAEPDPVAGWLVEQPGVYPDIPDRIYHLDPVVGGSLSSTGARLLLPPSCPALFQWRRTHPVYKDEFDFGHAAHQMVLGTGPEIVECKFDDWRTKAAQQAKKDARAAGKVPLLTEALQRVRAMAEAIQAHPLASRLFDPEAGEPEQTLVWQHPDTDTGVWCRARLDWSPDPWDGRFIIPDLKTADSADKGKFTRSAAAFGYPQQAAWYLDGVTALGLDDPAFVFVVIERDPPHLINIIELDQPSIDAGRRRNRAALDIYAACMASGEWPGYSDEVELVTLPYWYLTQDPSIGET